MEDFARTIDITDSNVVLQYGAAAQKNVSEFSENTLQQIRTKDLGQIGETLADLVRQLQEFDPEEEKKGFAGFFRRKKNQLAALKAGYAKASANVDQIVENLQAHQITLMKDVANLDQMIELNAKYQQELTMYILAGKQRLAQIQREDLAQLRQNADLLKTGTIDTAREAERSIVDLETLRHTNQQLMESLDEVLRIQTEGTQKRREAEAELGRIEGELKQKLLALRT